MYDITEEFEETTEGCFKPVDNVCVSANQVRERLFIGCRIAATNKKDLKSKGVSYIINLTGQTPPFPQDFTYYTLSNVVDEPTQDLLQYFPSCVEFIHRGLLEGTSVLVYCNAGKSRSCSVLISYLMWESRCSMEEALEEIRRARPIVCPNRGFQNQLKLWGKMNFTMEGNSPFHKLYRLQQIAKQMKEHERLQAGTWLAKDPQSLPSDMKQKCYVCNECGRELFVPCNILQHNCCGPWGKYLSPCNKGDSKEEYFVEPMEWIKNVTVKTEGCLRCPNKQCNSLLGCWTWKWGAGGCTCPSFRVQKDKVVERVCGEGEAQNRQSE